MTDIDLQPGQTAVVQVLPGVAYRITNEGWTVKVVSTSGILSVKPDGPGQVTICGGGTDKAIDEFLGIAVQ